MTPRKKTTAAAHDSRAIACSSEQRHLGEGVRWDERRSELLSVDILTGRVFRDSVGEDGALTSIRTYRVPGTVGAITPIAGDEGWLLAAGRGFIHLAVDGSLRTIAEVTTAGTRMNDAACDSHGRFWAGTVADDARPGGGALYRLDRNGQTTMVRDGLTISNGLGWSVDGRTMYLADSGPGVVHAFGFDSDRGTISDERVLMTIDREIGVPDGLTVDAEGDLWVAVFGGGRVQRYSPAGTLREELMVPAEQTTSCAFGGRELKWLYVTTATEHWTDEQRQATPSAGLVYRLDPGTRGKPAAPFRPEPGWWSAQNHGL